MTLVSSDLYTKLDERMAPDMEWDDLLELTKTIFSERYPLLQRRTAAMGITHAAGEVY